MAAPTSGPRPLTRLNTPFGTPASWRICAKINAEVGVNSHGFRMLAHGGADLGAKAVDEVEHALRHAGFMEDLRKDQRRVRGELPRLQDARSWRRRPRGQGR